MKNWISLAEKRYLLQDYEGAYLFYAYASFIGLPTASYAAGYMWEKLKFGEGTYECSLSSHYKCALFYYFNGFDYFKSQTRIADILSWKDSFP